MPDISKIRLPGSQTDYNIKDTVAREMIAGGISFLIVWTATDYASSTAPAASTLATIPAGVKVTYNNGAGEATGTLAAGTDTKAKFYLIYSKTQSGNLDVFDEYVTIENGSSYIWEKIGDTQIDLSDVVTDVSLSKVVDEVIGKNATFTITQPTITLAEDSTNGITYVKGGTTKYMAATASGTNVALTKGNLKATASGASTAWNSKDAVTAVTGYPNTTSDTFLKSASEVTENLVTTSITPVNGTETVSKVTKTASKLVTTSITPTNGTESVSKVTQSAGKLETTSITPTNGTESVSKVTKTASKLVQTTVPNVTANEDVTASKISSNSSVTANKSTWTFTMGTASGETETLIIGGGNGSDVTATNTAYSNVTASKTTLGTAVTVATGAVNSSGTGSDVVTGVTISDKIVAKAGTAVTVATGAVSANGTGGDVVSSMTISDKTVAKAGSAVTVATGSVASTGTGSDIITAVTVSDKTVAKAGTAVTVATGATDEEGTGDPVVTSVTIGTTGSALTGLGSPSTKSAIGGNSTFTITQPTIKLEWVDTAIANVTAEVPNGVGTITQPTIALSAESSSATGRQQYVQSLSTSKMKGTASGANTAWNNKDIKEVLDKTTDVSVTKGNQ